MNKTLSDLALCGYDVLEDIIQSDEFIRLEILYLKTLENDALISAFDSAKHDFERAKEQYHMYSIEMKTLKLQLSKAKEALYKNPDYKAFKEAEKIFQKELNQMVYNIGQSISPYIKTPLNKHIGGSCAIHK